MIPIYAYDAAGFNYDALSRTLGNSELWNACKFNGKERDTESGLDNFGARYDSSSLGRFMTPDWAARPTAVPYAVYGDPQSLNLYGYVRNDPISRFDADGHTGGRSDDEQCGVNDRPCANDANKAPKPAQNNDPTAPPPPPTPDPAGVRTDPH